MQTIWGIINILLTLLFGVMHQGGLVPSLFYLHDRVSALRPAENAHIIYWKTYMPPRHLLAIDKRGMLSHFIGIFMNNTFFSDVISGKINITDLAGMPPLSLYKALLFPSTTSISISDKPNVPLHSNETTYLVTPLSMQASLPPEIIACFSLDYRVFPHLDLDRIEESVEAGWKDGLSLGVWRVDKGCVSGADLGLD